MKRVGACLVAVVFAFVCLSPAAYAEGAKTEQFVGGMGKKFVRGVTNVFTGWVEIPVQISKGYKKACLWGAGVGIFTGVWHGVGRTFSGFQDMSGFWAADPADNEGIGIPLDAEYAWEDGVHYDLLKSNFGRATMTPVGNKLVRGLGNAAFGFLEVPGQLIKGMRSHACDLGIGKALWYWFSREINGIYDVATTPLPNPKDTMGLTFDEKWPWTALQLDK